MWRLELARSRTRPRKNQCAAWVASLLVTCFYEVDITKFISLQENGIRTPLYIHFFNYLHCYFPYILHSTTNPFSQDNVTT